jgi:hypothetical protein
MFWEEVKRERKPSGKNGHGTWSFDGERRSVKVHEGRARMLGDPRIKRPRRVARFLPGLRSLRKLRKVSQRETLLDLFPEDSFGAEIGVWRGDFSERLLSEVRPARLHLIDPWRFESDSEYRCACYGGAVAKNQAEMDAIYEGVLRRFASEIQAGLVFVHRDSSAQVGMKFPDAYFDWVYIDGNHLYEYVKRDLEVFATKLKPGGVLAGDDYGARGWWKGGVTRAVDEFVAARGCKMRRLGRQFVLLPILR